jgi:hypothetical protein
MYHIKYYKLHSTFRCYVVLFRKNNNMGNATHAGKKYDKPSKMKILLNRNVNYIQKETNSDIVI